MEDDRRFIRNLLIVLGVLAVAGVVMAVFAFWWFFREMKSRLPPQPPPPPTVFVTVGPGAAFKRYQAEVVESAERNLETLIEDARKRGAPVFGNHGPEPETLAQLVDNEVRRRLAITSVEAFFRGDPTPFAESGTPRMRDADAAGDLSRARDRHGRVVAGEPFESRLVGNASDTVNATVAFDASTERGGVVRFDVDLIYAGGGRWRVDEIRVLPYASGGRHTDEKAADVRAIERESCADCGALRYRGAGKEWQFVRGRREHDHKWEKAWSSGLLDPTPVGVLVLIDRAPVVAGVILRRVSVEHALMDRCDYDWAYRMDGGTSLDPSDPAVKSGRATQADRIAVAGVRIEWSPQSEGNAWLHLRRQAGETIADDDPRICVTGIHAFKDADAADPRWIFRASPSDEGRRVARAPK